MDDLEFIKKNIPVNEEKSEYSLETDSIGDRTTVKIIFRGLVLMEIDEHDWITLVNDYEGR